MRMIKKEFILISLLLISCNGDENDHKAPAVDPDGVVYIDEDFEDELSAQWEGQYSGEENFSLSDYAPYEGSASGKFTLKAGGDYWLSPNNGNSTARSEIQIRDAAPHGSEIYYSWYIRIDSAYVESEDWQLIGQFHDQPDISAGESWDTYPINSPPLAYKYRNGNLVVAVYSWEKQGVMDIAETPLSKGAWHRITTHVFWSTGDDGLIECWLDDLNIAAADGQTKYIARNCFNKAGNYLKIGLYRSNEILTEGTVYYDRIKSGSTSAMVR